MIDLAVCKQGVSPEGLSGGSALRDSARGQLCWTQHMHSPALEILPFAKREYYHQIRVNKKTNCLDRCNLRLWIKCHASDAISRCRCNILLCLPISCDAAARPKHQCDPSASTRVLVLPCAAHFRQQQKTHYMKTIQLNLGAFWFCLSKQRNLSSTLIL